MHEVSGRDDWKTAKGVEGEQIAVAGDEHIGMAADGQFEKLVVRGITASADAFGDGLDARFAQNSTIRPKALWNRSLSQTFVSVSEVRAPTNAGEFLCKILFQNPC